MKTRGYSVPGFRAGAKLPAQYLFQMFGEPQVKGLCASLLTKHIQEECEHTGLQLVGRGRVLDFRTDSFVAGQEHSVDIECDLWPDIQYSASPGLGSNSEDSSMSSTGYRGLVVSVRKTAEDREKLEKVKHSILEKYQVLSDTAPGHQAMLSDVLRINMQGYALSKDGSKGAKLPDIAKGEGVELVLEHGKFMEGMVESLVGCQAGTTVPVIVKFPVRSKGPGAALSGQEALFEVEVLRIQSKALPAWDAALAARIKEGMTLAELEGEVRKAMEGDAMSSLDAQRNEALATALLERARVSKLPRSLLDEQTQMRFQNMLMDFKEQGSTEEQLQEMSSPENFAKYKMLALPNVQKSVTLGLLFRDIAEKESIAVSAAETQEQIDVLNAQARQKGEAAVDVARAQEEIENALMRNKVFDFLAAHAHITYLEPVLEPASQPAVATGAKLY